MRRDNPGLRGRPVIVGGGVVLAASYEAGLRRVSGTPVQIAARLRDDVRDLSLLTGERPLMAGFRRESLP